MTLHFIRSEQRQLRWVGMLYRPSNRPIGQPLHGGVGLQNLPKMPETFRFGIHTDFAPKNIPHTNVTNRCFLQLPFTVPNCSHCSSQLAFLQETTIEWSGATPVPLRLDESTGFRFRHVWGPWEWRRREGMAGFVFSILGHHLFFYTVGSQVGS